MIEINNEQVANVAEILKNLPNDDSFLNFYSIKKNDNEIVLSDMYPPLDHPFAVEFFFFGCAMDYGFWYGDEKGYVEPLYGVINGKRLKGADLMWTALKKSFNIDSSCFNPAKFAKLEVVEFSRIFLDDAGPIPFPDFEIRFGIARAFGRWFLENRKSPQSLLKESNASSTPLRHFLLQATSPIPGYNDDPLFFKKNTLLAMALANRPERFLRVQESENWPPLIDYHVMRVALRLGLMDLNYSEELENKARKWVNGVEEFQIRDSAYKANEALIRLSGKPMKAVDKTLWFARKYCPEMEKLQCEKCVFDSVCKKRIDLFQPVFRTTAY